MTWTTPKVTEIAVGMEINCYACAEIAGRSVSGDIERATGIAN